jgi:putative ABC transport system ATP-binding protein
LSSPGSQDALPAQSRPAAPRVLARARDVSKTYASGTLQATVLHEVSLEIRAGEFALLMGPSGSGKTTLLCVLSGLLRPSAGEVELCDVPISRLADRAAAEVRRNAVGFVFQTYNLFPALSALDNVAEVLALKGMPRARAIAVARAALEEVGLGRRLDHRPGELSGGERQRVAIARAMAGRPSLIFGDEPTAALDRQTGLEVVELLKRQVSGDCGVLLVTHDPRLLPFADRLIEIDDGRILRDQPLHAPPAPAQAGAT